MIIRTDDILDACRFFKVMTNKSSNNVLSGLIQIKADGKKFSMHMSDGIYDLIYETDCTDVFNCTISADLFLDLIPRISSETIEFSMKDTNLILAGSGKYKFPAVYDGSDMLEIKRIEIENVTNSWTVGGDSLYSVYVNNSKQLQLGYITSPVQKLFYLDKDGAITFTSGACVNDFSLGADIKIALQESTVKLFAFAKDNDVDVSFGYSAVNGAAQPRIMFKLNNIIATYILPFTDKILSQIPVTAIRNRAHNNYASSVVLDSVQMKDILERISIFADDNQIVDFAFNGSRLQMKTTNDKILEDVYLTSSVSEPTEFELSIKDFKSAISSAIGKHFNMMFSADDPAIVINFTNIYNVIPKIDED